MRVEIQAGACEEIAEEVVLPCEVGRFRQAVEHPCVSSEMKDVGMQKLRCERAAHHPVRVPKYEWHKSEGYDIEVAHFLGNSFLR